MIVMDVNETRVEIDWTLLNRLSYWRLLSLCKVLEDESYQRAVRPRKLKEFKTSIYALNCMTGLQRAELYIKIKAELVRRRSGSVEGMREVVAFYSRRGE